MMRPDSNYHSNIVNILLGHKPSAAFLTPNNGYFGLIQEYFRVQYTPPLTDIHSNRINRSSQSTSIRYKRSKGTERWT